VWLETFQGSHEQPVQIAAVERRIAELAAKFNIRKIRIESWQGIQAAQSLAAIGLPAELYAPTAKKHAEEWPVLVQQLTARTVELPKHARLREELLNLVVEVGPHGVRVIDRGKVHQDHAVAVRGVVAMLASAPTVDGFGFLEFAAARVAAARAEGPRRTHAECVTDGRIAISVTGRCKGCGERVAAGDVEADDDNPWMAAI
jgi:hypothetical protein